MHTFEPQSIAQKGEKMFAQSFIDRTSIEPEFVHRVLGVISLLASNVKVYLFGPRACGAN